MDERTQLYGADRESVDLSEHIVVANFAESMILLALQEACLTARVVAALGWNLRYDVKVMDKRAKTDGGDV